jgi:pimeloyl-ACP methyl ester carboxylesterase
VSADAAELLVEGPWRHRYIAANGARFHVAEVGEGPLVLLLHGFPQFWWVWRDQLTALADAGYRAVAMDLRGYGASDKSPRGYDTASLAGDVSGVIRALGESSAVIVGHDWGGWLAWSMPVYSRRLTRAVAVVSMAHPLTLRPALQHIVRPRGKSARAAAQNAASNAAGLARQTRALHDVVGFQLPMLPERALSQGDGVSRILTGWGGPGYPEPAVLARYRRAMEVPFVAHTSLEYFRWAVRSLARTDGRRFAAALGQPIDVPVLQLHGGLDPYILSQTAEASSVWVSGDYESVTFPSAGHFLPEEASDGVTRALVDWLGGQEW